MKFITIIFIVVVILLFIKIISNSYEAFSINYKDELMETPYFDKQTGTLMAGSEFIGSQIKPNEGQDAYRGSFEDNYFLDDGANGTDTLLFNVFSSNCCAPQYPTSFELKDDGVLDTETYVMSPYTGKNDWGNSSCVCMTQTQRRNIENRYGNLNKT